MLRNALASLEKMDPALAWKAWQPSDKEPFDLKWAGHLYRRAAFGGTWGELQAAVKNGPDAAIDRLFKGTGSPEQLTQFDQLMDATTPKLVRNINEFEVNELQGMWLYRMIYSPHPLRERLTLFWHNHFATSVYKVRNFGLMHRQNVLLRKHALGKFEPFVQEMSKDPAMLVWLDSNSNVKGAANENFARELMELFTMGVNNGYTENDIREAALAFTGWHISNEDYVFNPSVHDDGAKTVLDQTGKWNGDDVVRILLKHPATARFLVKKLYRHFISEQQDPPAPLLDPLADQFRKDYDIAAVLRTMLRSNLFYSAHAYRQRIKQPAEYVVGMLRSLEGQVPLIGLAEGISGMGQTLFAPPNVKGWVGGKTWLNSSTLLARHNAAWRFVQGERGPLLARVDVPGLAKKNGGAEPAKQVEFLLDLTLQPEKGELNEKAREKLVAYLKEAPPAPKDPPPRPDVPPGAPVGVPIGPGGLQSPDGPDTRLRETAHAIMLMPEYQLA